MKHCGQNNEEIIHTYDLKFYLNYRSDLLIGVYPLREKNKKNKTNNFEYSGVYKLKLVAQLMH